MKIKEEIVKVEDKYVRWFSDIDKNDVKEVGGKAANLGEMIRLGMPVPQGFVINSQGYLYFLEVTELKEKIYSMLEKIDVEDTIELENTSSKIREMIVKEELPKELKEEILEAYEVLGIDINLQNVPKDVVNILKMQEPGFVAIRSSATAEDSSVASFAGQQETFLNIKGSSSVIEAVKKCFASLFTSRSVYYRVKKGFKHEDVLIAVVVQIMINSDKSGVIFSRDPVSQEENIVIEAVFGLGEGIVSGKIQPDNYVVSRELEILEKKIADKKIALTRNSAGETQEVKLTKDRSNQQVLTDYEIKRLASYALKLEEHYNIPQDIEFAIASGEIYILQTRPITTLEKHVKEEHIEGEFILQGLAASPGIGVGEVKIIRELDELSKIKKGDVLVTKMTNPDMVVSMQKCSAIVTDSGGLTAHAAIVSREMGLPAVVGTGNATQKLKDGMMVTVDGFKGKVYEGKIEELKTKKVEIFPAVKTETNIKVMVDLPSFAERASKTEIKEVGLVRLEGIIAESGKHPYFFLHKKEIDKYEEIIFSGLKEIGRYFDLMWIRTSDIRSDEFRNLEGSGKEKEANPMLGMHGIRAGLKYKEILKAEIKAISKLAENKKVGVMMPQVISVEEVRKVKEILKELGIENLDIGVMIETPASVEIIKGLCEEGISFISFGTNDLTQYTLAIDRGNEDVQYIYDEMNPAVLSQLEKVIRTCKKYNIETSICGQAGSKKEMVEFLVKLGIDSISVNADKACEISKFVKDLEDKGLRGSELKKEEIEKPEEKEQEKEEVRRRKSYPIICQECDKESEVPFKPKPGLPVYCRDCYLKKKKQKDKAEQEIKEEEKKPEEIKEENKPQRLRISDMSEIKDFRAPSKSHDFEASTLTSMKSLEKVSKEQNKPAEEENTFADTKFGFDIFFGNEQERKETIEEIEKQEISEEEKHEALEKEKNKPQEVEEEIEDTELVEEASAKEEDKGEESEIEEELRELEKLEEEKIEKASQGIENNEDVLDIF